MAKSKTLLPWSTVRNLMKKAGAEMVSQEAVTMLIGILEKRGEELTKKAIANAIHAKRKKVMEDDIDLAVKQ